jgi:hypothetical protein
MDITPAVPERASVVTRDQFSIDALAFISSAIDTYPIYGFESKSIFSSIYSFGFYRPMPTETVLLGVDCIPNSTVPLIVIQEPTMIGAEDNMAMQIDTLPPFDQVCI